MRSRNVATDRRPLFDPPLPVVIPPRPQNPEVVATRILDALHTGRLKHGNRWTSELTDKLSTRLGLGDEQTLLLTTSGTAALTLAVVAAAGTAREGDCALLPSFTFAATADVVAQLGFRPVFVDVRADTWTLDPAAVAEAIDREHPRLVVTVDALGLPSGYSALRQVCDRAGVPLVGDSAPALGAAQGGRPIGTQAHAHAFSMSFAKVVSAAGSGGAVVVQRDATGVLEHPVHWMRSRLMPEPNAVAALDLLDGLDALVQRRADVAAVYEGLAADREQLRPQQVPSGDRHAFVHWVARVGRAGDGRRDAVREVLARRGIETKPYYEPALHRQPWPGAPPEPDARFPVTCELVDTALALPMSSEITGEQAAVVADALDAALLDTEPPGAVRPAHLLGVEP